MITLLFNDTLGALFWCGENNEAQRGKMGHAPTWEHEHDRYSVMLLLWEGGTRGVSRKV